MYYTAVGTNEYGKRSSIDIGREKLSDAISNGYFLRQLKYKDIGIEIHDCKRKTSREISLEEAEAMNEKNVVIETKTNESENTFNNVLCIIFVIIAAIVIIAQVPLVYIFLAVVGIAVLALMLPLIANIFSNGVAVVVFLVIMGIVIAAVIMTVT